MKAGLNGLPFKLLCCGLLLAVLSGCAHDRNPGVVYYVPAGTPAPAPPPSEPSKPGSVRVPQPLPPVEAVPAPGLAPTPAPVPGVLSADVSVATSIGQLLRAYGESSGLWTRVEATVENGVVTLRGVVPSEHERVELVQRISRLAGVAAVKDHLQLSDTR